jgi:hypothetical protein
MNKPLSIGSVFSSSVAVLFSNSGAFFLMSLLIYAPFIAFTVWLSNQMTIESATKDVQLHALVLLVSNLLLGPLVAAAVTFGVLQRLRGKPASFGACLRVGFAQMFPVLGVALLTGLIVGLGSMLCLVPGLMFMMQYFVATPVAVVEGKGGMAALRRSGELTAGRRWPLFGLYVLVLIINIGVPQLARVAMISTPPTAPDLAHYLLVNTLVVVLLQAFYAVVVAVAYHDLRVSREGVDTEEIASVFD